MSFELTVRKKLRATSEKAFRAFTDAPTWSCWFSNDTQVDLRKGGRFSNSDGDTGEYLEIVINRLLVFTWEGSFAGSRIEIHFKPIQEELCEVSLRHYCLSKQEDVDKMKICWTWTLDNLASFLETGKPIPMSDWKTSQALP